MKLESTFEVVTSYFQLLKHLENLRISKVLGIDIETTGLDPLQDSIRLIQIATTGCPVIVFDMRGIDQQTRAIISKLLSSKAIKVFHNAKFDMEFLEQSRLSVSGRVFDTLIAGYLLQQKTELPRFGLNSLTQYYLSVDLSKGLQTSNWSDDLSRKQYEYAARDAAVLIPLREAMIRDLQSEDLTNIAKLEFGCLYAVAEMELTGIELNLERWDELRKQLEHQKKSASIELKKYFHRPFVQLNLFGEDTDSFNLDSQQQVLKALNEQGIPIKSTSRSQLIPLASKYPVVRQLLEYRRATKALQAFIYSIPETIHPRTGRLHPRYHQMGTFTGRFSCSHPNLQQIPRSKEFRHCFVAKAGHKLIIADYSQIELRVVAEISKDETMIQAYTRGQDLHRLTASLIANKRLSDVSKQERQAAKAVNFGLVYAMGARGLQAYARSTYGVTMTLDEAEMFRKRFFKAYSGVANWHKSVKISKERISRTLGGRKHQWMEAISVAGLYNWPVQGTAADIVKQAMADLVYNLKGTSAKIVGMVHDEIIIEAPEKGAAVTAEILKETMEHAGSKYLHLVPVVAETSIVENWAQK